MGKLIGPAIIIGLSLWGLNYTGPIVAENENFLISIFLWLLVACSGLSFVVNLLKLPFSRGT